jgi:hypothetical protein
MFCQAHLVDGKSSSQLNEHITYVDMLNVLLEKNKPNLECEKIISKITDKTIIDKCLGL